MATPNAQTSEIRRKGRQRLIGAVTIVLLLVVFVPMLLDPEPRRDAKEPVVAIPAKEGAPPLPTPAAPAKAPEPAAIQPAPVLADATKSTTAPKAPDAAKAETATAAKTATVTEPAKAPEETAAVPKLEGFAIQVGAFGDEEKLRLAREKLSAARITHFIERLPNGLTRLRTGPYKTREEAEKASVAVGAAGLDGKVVALP